MAAEDEGRTEEPSEYKLEKIEQVTHKIDTAMGKIIAQSVMK